MNELTFNITPSEFAEKDQYQFSKMWEKYNLEVLGHYFPKFPERLNNELEQNGYYINSLEEKEVTEIKDSIKKYGEKVKFVNDADLNFFYTNFADLGLEEDYNRDSKFLKIDLALITKLNKIFSRIKEDIAVQLGSPWRTHMVRIWETKQDAKKENMYGWHTDGMPHEFFKIMIYFNTLNNDNGTLELKIKDKEITLNSNDPGTYVLFKNSMIFHRGIPPQKINNKRLSCEVTISRSFNYFTECVTAGNNAHWPIAPWNHAIFLNNLVSKKYKREIKSIHFSEEIEVNNDYSEKLNQNQIEMAKLLAKIRKFIL